MPPRHLLSTLIMIFSLGTLLSPVQSQAQSQPPYWTKAAPPTVARQELYPEVLNRKIYVVGGLLSPNTGFSAHFESYDPLNDAWTVLRPLPEARHHITLSAVKGSLYGVGGFTGGFPDWRAQSTVFIYNPSSNTWTRGTDLPVARAEGISAVIDHKIYLVGGRVRAAENARLFDDHIDSVRNEVFDPATGRWLARADAPTPRNSAASAVIDGKIYVVGGRQFFKNADGTTRQVNVPNLEVYDPKLDRWQTRSPMPQARGGLAATSLGGKLYVFGGEQWVPEQKVFAESWVYDPKIDVWKALPPLPTPRHGLGASAVGDRIFVFGGGTRTGGNAATAIHEVLVLPRDL
ncbi:Kelch repeat-containing protein [Gloeobacter violaceus]|uniref:Gll3169 protein n=1 Tax=Gloeobacter violaceus (strain ATCC 29082 / PCC 7421) TaxID=251221 RepID=Q7NGK0_GLOVI|nr:kelch repeat-containing protein [Gloeobacter violaceus]BAC91110.1 gll3169 [Gloeobacter violaceus PCC 7421]